MDWEVGSLETLATFVALAAVSTDFVSAAVEFKRSRVMPLLLDWPPIVDEPGGELFGVS